MAEAAKRASETVAGQLPIWRKRRGLSAAELADRISDRHGGTLDRSAIAKIEAGTRNVSLDDLLLLAAGLAVPPPLLFLPLESGQPVAVTPNSHLHPDLAWQWIEGETPLARTDRMAMDVRWSHEARQPVAYYRTLRELQTDLGGARSAVKAAGYVGDEDQMRQARQEHADVLEALHAHLLTMGKAGITPPGMHPQTVADMEAVGLDVAGLPVFEEEGA